MIISKKILYNYYCKLNIFYYNFLSFKTRKTTFKTAYSSFQVEKIHVVAWVRAHHPDIYAETNNSSTFLPSDTNYLK